MARSVMVRAWEMRLAVVWFILFSLNSLFTCFVAVSAGCVWSNLDTQSRITVVIGGLANWTGTIMAFISKASRKIESGQNPISDDTGFTYKPKPDAPAQPVNQ